MKFVKVQDEEKTIGKTKEIDHSKIKTGFSQRDPRGEKRWNNTHSKKGWRKMKKSMRKIFALCLTLALVMSNASGVFAAATDECSHPVTSEKKIELKNEHYKVVCDDCGAVVKETCNHEGAQTIADNGDGTHRAECSTCGTIMSDGIEHFFDGGKYCIACGAEEPTCGHEGVQETVDNGDGTHRAECGKCGEVVEDSEAIPHYYIKGVCACGAVCKHVATDLAYTYNGDGTHTATCKCGEVVTADEKCNWSNGACNCGSEETTCGHEGVQDTVDNGDGTHRAVCKKCGEVVEDSEAIKHEYDAEGKCACGAVKETCKHDIATNLSYKNNEDGTHKVTCSCGTVVDEAEKCVYTDGKCICGADEPKCNHMGNNWTYDNNEDGTHNVVCEDCEAVVTPNVEHYYIDGVCICGAEEVTCDHMGNNWTYTNNEDGTHKVICADCEEVVTEATECVYTDGKCICGAELVVEEKCDHVGKEYTYANNEDGTHKVTCECGEVLAEAAECVWEEGACVCGSEAPATTCNHMGNNWTYDNNEDGTHKVICADCKEVVTEATECVYTEGKCICGAEKAEETPVTPEEPENPVTPVDPVDPEEPTTPVEPEEPATPVDPEDKTEEPATPADKTETPAEKTETTEATKTGDATAFLPFVAVMMVSAAGAAIVLKKRYHA